MAYLQVIMSTPSSENATLLIVFVYMQEGEQPQRFTIPLEDGWFAFSRNQTFLDETGYRQDGSGLMIYDVDSGEFIPLLTGGGLEIDSMWHPWLIEIRRNIWSILGEDYPRFPDGPEGGNIASAGGETGHEVIVIEDDSDDDMEVVVTMVGRNNGTFHGMVIDDDSSDSDYVDEGSGAGSSEEGEGEVEMDSGESTEVEEEDAVETCGPISYCVIFGVVSRKHTYLIDLRRAGGK